MTDNVKSAVRVLEILDFFDGVRREASVTEIANELGIPPSSTVGILRSMVRLGYLAQDEHRKYSLTSRVALLGNWIDKPVPSSTIRSVMDELSGATGETITLGIPAGQCVKYISVVPPRGPVPLRIMPGDTRPLATSGVGRLFLSTMPEGQVRQVVFRHNAQQGDAAGQLSLLSVFRDLEHIRDSGYVLSDRLFAGAALVCVALPHCASESPMAISVSGQSSKISSRSSELAALMKRSIQRAFDQHAREFVH